MIAFLGFHLQEYKNSSAVFKNPLLCFVIYFHFNLLSTKKQNQFVFVTRERSKQRGRSAGVCLLALEHALQTSRAVGECAPAPLVRICFLWRSPLSQYLSSRLRTVYSRVYTQPVVESPLAAARTSGGPGITLWHQLCRRGGDPLANTTLRWLAATLAHLICSSRPRAAACVAVCACNWIRIGGMRKCASFCSAR